MKKVKVILLVFSILIILPVITLLVLSNVHSGPAHRKAVEFLNQEFEEDVSFQDFSFSYIRNFPNIHFKVSNVRVLDRGKEVITLEVVRVVIAPGSLWNGQVHIKKVLISGGTLMSEIDGDGNKPRILARKQKPTGEESQGIKLHIDSHDIQIKDSRVFFGNKVKRNRMYVAIKQARLNLEMMDSLIVLTGSLDGHLDSLISNNSVLFANQSIRGEEIDFRINLKNGDKVLDNGYLMARNLKLYPRFRMSPKDDGQMIEFHISGDSTFDSFLELFEFHLGIDLQQTNPDAELRLSYNQVGFVNPFLRPYSELDFEIIHAEFTGSDLPYPIENVYIDGNYNNGEGHSPETVQLYIDTIHAEIRESFINARLKLDNLKDPYIDAHFVSSLDIGHLIRQSENLSLSGVIDADLRVTGRISELKAMHLEGKQHASGSINIKDLKLFIRDQGLRLELVSGSSMLNNHLFEITSLLGAYNESAFHFKGLFENLDKYILAENDRLGGKFVLSFDRLDLRQPLFTKSSASAGDKPEGIFSLPDLALDLELTGKEILTEYGPVSDFHMVSHLENTGVNVSALDFRFQDGSVKARGDMGFDMGGISHLNADIRGEFKHLELDLAPKNNEKTEKDAGPFILPAYLNASIQLRIEDGRFQQYPLQNLIFEANVKGNDITIGNLTVDALGGHSSLHGALQLDTTGIREISLTGGMNFRKLDLEKVVADLGLDKSTKKEKKSQGFPQAVNVKLDVSAGEVIYKDANIKNFSTHLAADNNNAGITNFYADLPFGNLSMDITVAEYRNKDRKFKGSVDLWIDSLSVEQFMEMEALGIPGKDDLTGEGGVKENKRSLISLPENILLDLHVGAHVLDYRNARVNDLDLAIHYRQDIIDLERLTFKFAEGAVDVHGNVRKDRPGSFPGYLYSKVDSLDITNLLHSFNNFDQDKFTAENSSGKISWASHYYFELGKNLVPVRDGNLWIMNIIVHEAEFDKVEPIEKTLFFVGHKSKDAMIISKLNINAMLFRDKLYCRDVLMNDNIANLDVSGEVDLDARTMDLGLEISLSDLFFRTKSKRVVQTQEGEIDLEKDSRLFLNLSGPLTDHKLKLINKRKFNKARDDLERDIKAAENEFRNRQK